jgi:sodium-dependent phosphate transporter
LPEGRGVRVAVGATVGVGIAFGGMGSVFWGRCAGSTCDGVLGIVLSWFLSPALAGAFAAAIFLFTKYLVLRAADPFRRALCVYPVYIFVTWTVRALSTHALNPPPPHRRMRWQSGGASGGT